MPEDSSISICQQCGATIYPEMIEAGRAGTIDGKLLCPHCYRVALGLDDSTLSGSAMAQALSVSEVGGVNEPIEKKAAPKVTYNSGGIAFERSYDNENFKRPLLTGTRNATRCRTFHAKLTDASMAHMDDMINEWADAHEDIEIKFVTSSIGVVEGKHSDPHLIITCWY